MDSFGNRLHDLFSISRCRYKECRHKILDARGHLLHHVLHRDKIQHHDLHPILLVEREDLVPHKFLHNEPP